jgi:alcohol dehydrogenase class IV
MRVEVHSFQTAKKIVFGRGALKQLGEEAKRISMKRIAVITDPGVENAGLVDQVTAVLADVKIEHGVWNKVEPEPALAVGEAAIDFVRAGTYDAVLGVGGGSSLDTAKAAAAAVTNPGRLQDWVTEPFHRPPAPFILIPTTAGTGSEVSNVAIFATPEVKYALYSPLMYPDLALVEPALTRTLPPPLTAYTGVDALCHAMEAYVSLQASPITDTLAVQAIHLITTHLRSAYHDGENMDARAGMALAALLAGMAFGNAGTVLGHACGYAYVYPATGLHFPHGYSIGTTMPYVLEYNAVANPEKHATIAQLLGEPTAGISLQRSAYRAAVGVQKLLQDLNMPTSLQAVGVTREMIPTLARNVFRSPKHVARNPRPVTVEDMIALFTKAYDGRLASEGASL